jgi:hypothetical protein
MTLGEKRLKRMLAHRELMERVEETRFATVRQATARREQAVDAAQQRRVRLYTLGGPDRGSLDAPTESGRSAYTVRLGRELATGRAALEVGRRQEAVQREHLLDRRKDRMAIEALLERLASERRIRGRRHSAHVADEWAARDWYATRTAEEADQ